MPRIGSRSRFSFLEKAAKQAGLQAAPNSPVGRYLAYKKTETEVKRKKTLTAAQLAAQRSREVLALVPFGINVGGAYVAGDFRQTTVTQWSRVYAQGVTGLTLEGDLGWRGVTATTPDGGDFYPAQLLVSVPTGTADPNSTSQITGRKYKYQPTNSYTLPFGRNATPANGELTRRNALFALFKGLTGANEIASVSYKPEYFDPQTEAADEVAGLTDTPAAT